MKDERRERLLYLLAAITFLIFFQAYMVAPLIPRLSRMMGVSAQNIGLLVPAYLIPYGVSTLFFGLLSDRIGRRRIMLVSLIAFAVLTGLTATAATASQMIAWRFLTGLGASGVVPLALALVGTLFPYEQRGRPLGWLFGAMAGGMAFGSTFGVLLEAVVGWRALFLAVSICGMVGVVMLLPYCDLLGKQPGTRTMTVASMLLGYKLLLSTRRAQRTYAYVLVNAIFHSGIFTWLGLFFEQRYRLGEVGIGLALLGYGVPGFLLGPLIGHLADRQGRRRLIPAGIGLAAFSVFLLVPTEPLAVAVVAVTALSLGYDLTQPLLAGIVTSLDPKRAGQAMGLNVFTLFIGFGLGSLLFGWILQLGFQRAFLIFAFVQIIFGIASIAMFNKEQAQRIIEL